MKLTKLIRDLLMTKYNQDYDGNRYQDDGGVMGRLLYAPDFFKQHQHKLFAKYDVLKKEQATKLLDLYELVKSKEDNHEMCIVDKGKLRDLLMTKYNQDYDGNRYQDDGGVMGRLLYAPDFFKQHQHKLFAKYDVLKKEQATKLLDLYELIGEPQEQYELIGEPQEQEQSIDDISNLVNIIGQENPMDLVDII